MAVRCFRAAASLVRAPQVRWIRTGFFPEDPDYIDPEGPLLATPLDSRWRLMDDPSLRAPVLERSNVGMGMVVMNQSAFDLPMINELYRRLRNLEVNTLKRFVGLSAREPGPFSDGLMSRELLLASTMAMRKGRLPPFSRALLWHQQELAHLVGDYRKPLVCQISGAARNGGAALAALANFNGAYRDSELAVDACFMGLVPDSGMTYVLGQLQWHLGEFLALTGWPVRGADLVYTGLARYWLSPDALPLLELTSEKQLEVSEADARALLDEHSLVLPGPPDSFCDGSSVPRAVVTFVDKAFRNASIGTIVRSLEKIVETAPAYIDKSVKTALYKDPLLPKVVNLAKFALKARELKDSTESARFRQLGLLEEGGPCWFMPKEADVVRQELRGMQATLKETLTRTEAERSEAEAQFKLARKATQEVLEKSRMAERELRSVRLILTKLVKAKEIAEDTSGAVKKELAEAEVDGSEVAVARDAAQEADMPATQHSEPIREAEEDVKRAKAEYEDFQAQLRALNDEVGLSDLRDSLRDAEARLASAQLVFEAARDCVDVVVAKFFAEESLRRMRRGCGLPMHATLRMIREARTSKQGYDTHADLGRYGENGVLTDALRLELRVQQRLLRTRDAAIGLHAHCLGREPPEWERKVITDVAESEVDRLFDEPKPFEGEMEDFAVAPRAELPLSMHPRLRRYHPDFDPKTGMDHDPAWMADEVRRWSPDLFAKQRSMAVAEMMGDRDPASYGMSRWVRVSTK